MVSRERAKRECGTDRGRVASGQNHAAPATVSGERLPYATDAVTHDGSGRRRSAPTRKPGNLPSIGSNAGRGASVIGAAGDDKIG